MDDNVKNILYVAIAIDMASGERLPSAKIGISATNADKRITQLNSTKMPISVELTAAWAFEGAKISARDAESAAHTLLRPLQVNGEWYSDDDDDLSDRIAKFVKKLGAKPVGDDTAEYAAMNEKQRKVRDLLESAFEKLRPQLDGLGIEWEYMQWRVGLTTPLGRNHLAARVITGCSFASRLETSDNSLLSRATTCSNTRVPHTRGHQWLRP